jgi:hypothetical protein
MITYISLELSTDGPMPSNIDRTLEGAGLRRCGSFYALEPASEVEMEVALARLHLALRGSGVRYRLHGSIPRNVTPSSSHTVDVERECPSDVPNVHRYQPRRAGKDGG